MVLQIEYIFRIFTQVFIFKLFPSAWTAQNADRAANTNQTMA